MAAGIGLAGLLLAGCAHGVRLSDADRAQLRAAPQIHVLPYETPLPRLKLTAGRNATPTPTEIRRHAAADPATLVAQGFVHLLGKKERLRNLHVEPIRPPPVKSATEYGKYHWHGLALDLWVDDWAFEELAGEPGRYNMRLTARARLARIDDGRVLWSTGRCSLGDNGRELHLSRTELTRGTRLRKILAYVRDECARQLFRDFSAVEDR